MTEVVPLSSTRTGPSPLFKGLLSLAPLDQPATAGWGESRMVSGFSDWSRSRRPQSRATGRNCFTSLGPRAVAMTTLVLGTVSLPWNWTQTLTSFLSSVHTQRRTHRLSSPEYPGDRALGLPVDKVPGQLGSGHSLYNSDTAAAAATVSNTCGMLVTPQVGRDYTP